MAPAPHSPPPPHGPTPSPWSPCLPPGPHADGQNAQLAYPARVAPTNPALRMLAPPAMLEEVCFADPALPHHGNQPADGGALGIKKGKRPNGCKGTGARRRLRLAPARALPEPYVE